MRPPSNAGYAAIEMMVVMSLMGLLTAMSVPSMSAMLGYYRLSGDIRNVSNTVAVAKTRAAAAFTRGRLYVDLTSGDYHVETWRKSGTPGWVAEGGYGSLSVGNNFGLAGMDTPPPNTQSVIALSPACLDDDGAAGSPAAKPEAASRATPSVPVVPAGPATPAAAALPTTEDGWRTRIAGLRQTLARNQVLADALQSRIDALWMDFVNRDDPAQRSVVETNRITALTELDRMKADIKDGRKAITDLEEQARRAGVPPGWLR